MGVTDAFTGIRAERLRETWRTLLGATATADGQEEEPGDALSPKTLDLVLRAGELLLASGEATERVNEAMLSLAVAYELPRCEPWRSPRCRCRCIRATARSR